MCTSLGFGRGAGITTLDRNLADAPAMTETRRLHPRPGVTVTRGHADQKVPPNMP